MASSSILPIPRDPTVSFRTQRSTLDAVIARYFHRKINRESVSSIRQSRPRLLFRLTIPAEIKDLHHWQCYQQNTKRCDQGLYHIQLQRFSYRVRFFLNKPSSTALQRVFIVLRDTSRVWADRIPLHVGDTFARVTLNRLNGLWKNNFRVSHATGDDFTRQWIKRSSLPSACLNLVIQRRKLHPS